MNPVAENMLRLRRQRGMTQAELAEKMAVTRQTISNWERSISRPDVETLGQLAVLLGVPVDQLIYPPEKRRRDWLSPLSPAFVPISLGIYFFLFLFGGAYLAVPLCSRLFGGGISEQFLYFLYWGLFLTVGFVALCTCLIAEMIAETKAQYSGGTTTIDVEDVRGE